MLAAVLRILLSLALRLDLALGFLLILDEFDVGYLHLGRWGNQEEESQNKESEHAGHMEKIRSTGSLGHLHDGIGIYLLAVQAGGMIIGIPHTVSDEGEEKTHENHGSRTTQVQVAHGAHELDIGLDIVSLAETL